MGIRLVIPPPCLYTSGRVYWVLFMGRIQRNPQLAHMALLSIIIAPTIQSDSIVVTIYHCIQYSISASYKLIIAISYLSIQNQYHVKIISLLYCFVQLCIISTFIYPTFSVHFKYWRIRALHLLMMQVHVLSI